MLTYPKLKTWLLIAFLALGVVFALGCGSSPTGQGSVSLPTLDVVATAREAADGVGAVLKTNSNGNKGHIFVFEEFHTSRIGQLQIAAMLVRLHDKYGLKRIGLEGKVQSSPALDAAWYRSAGGEPATAEREDLAVRIVAEGEISSAELMAMQYPDVVVDGTEDAQLYAQTLDVKGNPEVEYLIGIAEKSLSGDTVQKVNKLLEAKSCDAAIDTMMNSDPWVKQRYDNMKNDTTTSSEKMVADLRELQAKADSVGATVSPDAKQGVDKVIEFYQTASKRSDAMVDKVLEIAAAAKGSPVAMIIGAAHADRVTELLTKQNVSFALIQPADLDPKNGSLTTEQYERKAKGLWARNSKGTLGRVLNVQRKPPPVTERVTGQSYASMNLAGMIVAKAARSGKRVPDDILPQLSALPGLRVDTASFSRDGYDVIFCAWLKQDDGREKEVWARVGTIEHPSGVAPTGLEAKLIKAADDLKTPADGGGRRGGGRLEIGRAHV